MPNFVPAERDDHGTRTDMVVSEKTVQRWQDQLAINERLLSSQSDRFRWLRRLYVRLYQFLVSRYGEQAEPLEAAVENQNQVSRMPFEDLTLDHRGLQPRSAQSVRYVLEQIQS